MPSQASGSTWLPLAGVEAGHEQRLELQVERLERRRVARGRSFVAHRAVGGFGAPRKLLTIAVMATLISYIIYRS